MVEPAEPRSSRDDVRASDGRSPFRRGSLHEKRHLGCLDAMFLAAEAPTNYAMHTMAIMALDPSTMPPGDRVDTVRSYLASRIHLVPPLYRRLIETPLGLGTPVWVEDRCVDLDRHVQPVVLPRPGTPRQLASFVSERTEHKLDRRYPLWEMHVVEGYGDGTLPIVVKVHHALMDGIAGMSFMASLFAPAPDSPPSPVRAEVRSTSTPSGLAMAADDLASAIGRPFRGVRAAGDSLLAGLRILRGLTRAGRLRVTDLTVPFTAPRVPFGEPITPRREVAFTSLPLDQVRLVARAFDVTVNDAVLTVVSGALRSYLTSLGKLPTRQLVAALPVSVRGRRGTEQANLVTLMLSGLATDRSEPADRLAAIHAETRRAKLLQSDLGPDTLLEWLEVPPPILLSMAAQTYSGMRLSTLHRPLCNLVVSNVPGPPVPLYFGGARVSSIFPFGPIFDGVGLNITLLSGQERVDVGLVACPDRLRGLWDLARGLQLALEELRSAASARPNG